jgi:hypothetical protein
MPGHLVPIPEPFCPLAFRFNMESHIAPPCSRWKSVGLWILLGVALPVAMPASAEPANAEDLRQQAVSEYIDGATKELEAFGQQISAAARPDNQQLCTEAKAKLNECNGLVADLKTADSEHFDGIKASYERTRGELVKALQAARGK